MIEANLFEFLHTIPTDPLEPIGPDNPPLRVFQNPPTPTEVGYAPYALVEEAPGNVLERYFEGSDVMTSLVTVSLHQSPDAQGRTPSRLPMRRLIREISKAVHFVDEDVESDDFVGIERQAIQRPIYNPDTKGLFGAVRFRLLYFQK